MVNLLIRALVLAACLIISNAVVANELIDKLEAASVEKAFKAYLASGYDQRLNFFSREALVRTFESAYLVSDDNKKLKALKRACDELNAIDTYEVLDFAAQATGEHIGVRVNALDEISKKVYILDYEYVSDSSGEPKIGWIKIKSKVEGDR